MSKLISDFTNAQIDMSKISELNKSVRAYIDEPRELDKEENWQVFEFLSPLREGLFSWYDFGSSASVLEIGAGFGAVTGVLCRKCSKVTATERSLFRAQSLQKRYESADNLTVYAGDVFDIAFGEKFDYVVLTGLLEKIGGEAAVTDYLCRIKSLLKEDGTVLAAVDNRFALRNMCGYAPSQTNRAFAGLNGYKDVTVKGHEFTKSELEKIINAAGYGAYKFYYPLPDYKFTQFVFSDDVLPEKDIKDKLIPYYLRNDTLVAYENDLYEDVVNNGSFPFMANSFLVEIRALDGSLNSDFPGKEVVVDGSAATELASGSRVLIDGVSATELAKGSRLYMKKAAIDRKRITDNARRLESEEEKIADYKVSETMKKVWNVELAMLDEVDRICKKYNLTYFLVHGSLLGALRHKGFIPWDDDLDIAMPRQSYDKFHEVIKDELEYPLSFHDMYTETEMFWGGIARIRNEETSAIPSHDLMVEGNKGIWIDILPYDICPEDETLLIQKEKALEHAYKLYYAKVFGKKWKMFGGMKRLGSNFYRFLSVFYSKNKICDMINEAMKMHSDAAHDEISFFTGMGKARRLLKSDFDEAVYMTFAGRQVPVPKGYENYLIEIMGRDYLKYPPEEERKPKHSGIWDPDRTYKTYTDMLCGTFEDCDGKQIILFGAGLMFEDYMKKYGDRYRPAFLVDNDENKWGRNRQGIPIKSPEDILKVPQKKRHLIICSAYYLEIEKQLAKMGITDYKVYVQHIEWIMETEERRQQEKL